MFYETHDVLSDGMMGWYFLLFGYGGKFKLFVCVCNFSAQLPSGAILSFVVLLRFERNLMAAMSGNGPSGRI